MLQKNGSRLGNSFRKCTEDLGRVNDRGWLAGHYNNYVHDYFFQVDANEDRNHDKVNP